MAGQGRSGRVWDVIGSRKKGNVVRGCCWDEGEFETELFIGIAQLTLGSGTW
jgi:hypothetical protein